VRAGTLLAPFTIVKIRGEQPDTKIIAICGGGRLVTPNF